MAEGRFVSRSIATNQQLGRVSFAADYLFARCVPHLDVEGRMPGAPELIKSIACPMRQEITVADIPGLIRELARAEDAGGPLVLWYEVGGVQVLAFPGFGRQQKGLRKDREAPSRLPAFSRAATNLARDPDEVRTDSGATPDLRGSNSGLTPAQGEGEVEVEVEGEVQGEVKEHTAAASSSPEPARASVPVRGSALPAPTADDGGDVLAFQLQMRLAVDAHAAGLDELGVRRFTAAAAVLVSGADSSCWRDPRSGRQVAWAERPRLLEIAIAKLAAGERDSIRGALTLAIQQQLDPLPVRTSPVAAGSQAAAVLASGNELPQSRETRTGSMERTDGYSRDKAERAAQERDIAEIDDWTASHPDEAKRLLLQVKAWVDTEFAGNDARRLLVQPEYRKRVRALLDNQAAAAATAQE